MDETQLLDCTQPLACDLDDDEEEGTNSLVAWLEVNGSKHEIFSGRNIIGRDLDSCQVVIPNKILSKQHAVVEVRTGTHTLSDLGSSNKTRLGKMVLRPHVQYALRDGERIRFGNVAAIYTIKPEECCDSGSETGSESMLPVMSDEEERSSSPFLSPRPEHRASQGDQGGTVENGIAVSSVSPQDSHPPQAKGSPPLASPGMSLLRTPDSFLQLSDAESSVISASQSPAVRTFTPLTHSQAPQEEYNSDASTDLEDNTKEEPCLTAPQCKTPTNPASCTTIPETPAQPSNSIIANSPGHSSSNMSVPETPGNSSPLSPKRENTSTLLSHKTNTCETPSCSVPSATVVETPARSQKEDLPRECHDNEDMLFKKPLATSTVETCRTPTAHTSPKSSVVSKAKQAMPVHLFSTKNSHHVDSDVQTEELTSDAPCDVDLDAPTQVFTSDIDLEAPTQPFTHDKSVDLDAPTQVYTSDVDLDAPTQVFTNEGSSDIDLDAPTQVFTSEVPCDVDLDAPTQVFTNEVPSNVDLDAPAQVFMNEMSSDVDLDAPTQVFTSDVPSNVDTDAPTQVFTADPQSDIDLDAPTQVFTNCLPSTVDPDAPTQVFSKDAASDVDPDAPTQVFSKDAASSDDPDVPTQVFTKDAADDIDPDAPTQIFNNDTADRFDPDAPTQVFSKDAASSDDPDVPTQVFTKDAADDVDPDAPTQVFNNDTADGIDPDAPTQVFNNDAADDVDPDAPTQVFTKDAAEDVDPGAPTQVFDKDAADDVDPDAPTQVFNNDAADDVDPDAPTQVFNNDAADDVDPEAPTQVFNNDTADDVDPDAPTQVFNNDAADDVDPDAPTQVFNNDTADDVDPDAPTQVFNNNAADDVDPDAPTQVFDNNAADDVDPDAPTQVFNNDTADGIDPDAPTQVFNNDAADDVDPEAPTQVFNKDAADDNDFEALTQVYNNDAARDVDPDAPTQVFTSDAPSDVDPDAPTQIFPDKAPGNVDDKHDSATHPLPPIGALNEGDPPGSPTILSDTDNDDIPTQPYSHVHAGGPKPSSSILEAWGRLESTASQSTNTDSLPDLYKVSHHESDAVSDASESLFNEEDEVQSLHDGEEETDVYEDIGSDHKTKGENSHSGESTDLKKGSSTETVVRNHKTGGKEASSQSFQSKDPNENDSVNICLRTPRKKEGREPTWESESESEENSCEESLRLFDLPTDAEVREQMTSPQHSSSLGDKESSEDILADTPHKERTGSGEMKVTEQTTSARLRSRSRINKKSEHILAVTPQKGRAKHHEGICENVSEENINDNSLKLPAKRGEVHGKNQTTVAYPTRRTSTRLSSQGNTAQSRRGRAVCRSSAAVSVAVPSSSASSPTTTHVVTQACTPSSLTSASNSTPTPLLAAAIPNTSTFASTSTSTSTNTQASLQSTAVAPTTRRQGRKSKLMTDINSAPIPVTDSPVFSIPTRRYRKRGIKEDEVGPATTTTNNNKYSNIEAMTTVSITTTATTTTPIPATSFVTATTTATSSTASTTSSPTQTRKTRQRTQLNLDVKDQETVSVIVDNALPQSSTAATTDTSIIPATTKRRRGRPSTKPPAIKIKVEAPDDEPTQMTTLTTIKEEKKEIETLAYDQIPIKMEPEDNFSPEESKQPRRTRRRPERFSPERDSIQPGKNLRSKKSEPSLEPTGRVLRESTGGAKNSTVCGSRKALGDPVGRQRRSQRVQVTTMPGEQEEGGEPAINPKESYLKVRVKEEPEDSEEKPSESLSPYRSGLPETDSLPKRNSRSRASTSKLAQQAPSRPTKKIKMEVIPKEECEDDIPEVTESSIVQSRAKETRTSYSKRRSNQNVSSGQRAKRSNSDVSDAGSLASNNSFSSRATRSNKDVELWSPSKRQRQASSKPRVLFTGYHDPTDHKIVTDLGGRVVETPLDCTVLVTTKLKRTCKLLSAIGRGRLIVNPTWLTMSKAAGNFVDPWQFLLKDPAAEEKYGFCLEATIKSASTFLLFEGLSMHATPSVLPPPCQMRDIIECAGGDYLHAAPKKYEPQIRIISCPEDKRLWSAFRSLGIPILGMEFILTGLLRHELLLDEFVLG